MTFQLGGDKRYYACTDTGNNPRFAPTLPKGLQYTSGLLLGSPTRRMKNEMLRIITQDSNGYVWITGGCVDSPLRVATESLTDVGAGFDTQVIYRDTPFLPIRLFPDSGYDSFSITPNLPEGVMLDESTGLLSGVCTGPQETNTYTISVNRGQHSVSSVVQIDCKGMIVVPSRE